MNTPMPRYRCAVEVGFLPAPKPYVMTRVENGQEFDFDGKPGNWMEPVNEAAFERVEALVAANKRKTVNAPETAANGSISPPRSGMAGSAAFAGLYPNQVASPAPQVAPAIDRPAPRRRTAKAE